MRCVRPRPLPLLAVVAASASLAGAGRLWFSALKSDRIVDSPPALHAPPLVTPSAPEPPLVVHAQPVAPPAPKAVVKHVQPHVTHKTSRPTVSAHGVGGVAIIADIGTAETHTETPPVVPAKPIVVTPLPQQPSGHGKAPKPKKKPAKPSEPSKPVTPPVVQTPAPPPVSTPTPPVATPTPPAAAPPTTSVVQQTPAPPVTTPAPPVVTPPSQPTPPVVNTPSPPVVNAPQDTSSDTRPGNGYGDKNHTHTGPPGQNKK
jgi:hypothetical protein